MFKIGKLFHLTHVVSDLAAVDEWYDDVFGVTRFYRGYDKAGGPRRLADRDRGGRDGADDAGAGGESAEPVGEEIP
jgi:hypothetical protein